MDEVLVDSGVLRLGPAIFQIRLVKNKVGKETLLILVGPDKGTKAIATRIDDKENGGDCCVGVVAP